MAKHNGFITGEGYCLENPHIVAMVDAQHPDASVSPDGLWVARTRIVPGVPPQLPPKDSTVVTTVVDSQYFHGLEVLRRSLRDWHPDLPLFVIDVGLTEQQRQYLISRVHLLGSGSVADNEPVWAKFEGSFLPYPWIIHLDCDLVVTGALDLLFERNAELVVARNLDWPVREHFVNIEPLLEMNINPDGPSFNAGVLAYDNRVWGHGRLKRRILEMKNSFDYSFRYAEQSALHLLFCGRDGIRWLPDTYNVFVEFWDWENRTNEPRIVHFAGDNVKPWHPEFALKKQDIFLSYSKLGGAVSP